MPSVLLLLKITNLHCDNMLTYAINPYGNICQEKIACDGVITVDGNSDHELFSCVERAPNNTANM